MRAFACTRVSAFLAVTLGVLSAAGCTTEIPIEETSEGMPLTAYVPPPSDVPELRFGNTALVTSAVQWRVRGKWVEDLPEAAENVQVNVVPLTSQVSFSANAPLPGMVDVQFFPQLPPISDDTDARSIRCGEDPACLMTADEKGFTITVADVTDSVLTMTITATYPTFEHTDQEAGISSYAASWVLQRKMEP